MSNIDRLRELAAEIRDRLGLLDVEVAKLDPPPATYTIKVKPGDDIGAAFRTLYGTGGIILAAPGNYKMALQFPERPSPKHILFTTDTANLPEVGVRMDPSFAPGLAHIRTADPQGYVPAFEALPRSAGVTFTGCGFGSQFFDRSLVHIGDDKMTLAADEPSSFAFDRVYAVGDPVKGQHQFIMAHGKLVSLTNSYCTDFFEAGRDSHVIAGWNGGHGVFIDNNFLEASGENVLTGGSAATSPEMIPADWRITRNLISKPVRWQKLAVPPSVKCLLEIKNIHRAHIEGNVGDGCWNSLKPGGSWSTGIGFVFKVSPNGSLFTEFEDVVCINNIIRNVGAVFSVVGSRDSGEASGRMKGLTIQNNLAYNVNVAGSAFPGDGKFLAIANPPLSLHVEHNTIHVNTGALLDWWTDAQAGPAVVGGPLREPGTDLRVTDNVVAHGGYGVRSPTATGVKSLDLGWPASYVVNGNAIKKHPDRTVTLPAGNVVIDGAIFEACLDAEHKVIPGSAISKVVTTDGKMVGADIDAIKAALAPTESL